MEPRVLTLPDGAEMFFDVRGVERCLRVSWHRDLGLVVVSVWRGDMCVGTVRLPREDVPALITTLAQGLGEPPSQGPAWGEAS
jgi:hypothetical protein